LCELSVVVWRLQAWGGWVVSSSFFCDLWERGEVLMGVCVVRGVMRVLIVVRVRMVQVVLLRLAMASGG